MLRSLLLVFFALDGLAQGISLSEYAGRREALRKTLTDGVVVMWAAQPPPDIYDRNGVFQEQYFFYLTGWKEPNAALLLCGACPAGSREVLFLPKRNARKEIFEGPQVAPGDRDAVAKTGFATVLPFEKLEGTIARALESAGDLYTLFDGHETTLAKIAPLREVKDVKMALNRMRMKKSDAEIALLQNAVDASVAAHLESWTVTKPGLYEYEVSAVMQQVYYSKGCERNAYPPTVGSGPNSVILHYSANKRRMDAGDVMVLDVAAECSMYAADITRTIPVDGTWTERQKQIYQMVLGAQQAVIDAAKPGMLLSEMTKIARDYFDKQGNGPNGKPWGSYLTHGVSHHIGLDVHDPFDPAMPLPEGAVITVEPGLYLPEENLGVRIEDMIVLTKDGSRLMTSALPREPDEIERRMKH
ncbi:M24 family metallopeptidase [Bryobacter aggregatus]|uniref:M24 family metallopeptidase n=1 Tax=Bryobacter aggregatus TaxID=360054 RepID=UPI0006892C22|nr:Xaa-Pro peptidase family protein [Bryobacter aggregatus]